MTSYRKKIRNFVPKEFMATQSHVLCSNLTEIDRRNVGGTMRCLVTKIFSPLFCVCLAEVRQKFAGSALPESTSTFKISSRFVPVFGSYFKKVISYNRCMPSGAKNDRHRSTVIVSAYFSLHIVMKSSALLQNRDTSS